MNDIQTESIPSGTSTEAEKEALRHSIEQSEAELREAVEELTAAVKHEVSLGQHIIDHPTVWLAGGFFMGMLLARRH